MDKIKPWSECLIWTSVIGVGLILIDIIGNVTYGHKIKEWKKLAGDEMRAAE